MCGCGCSGNSFRSAVSLPASSFTSRSCCMLQAMTRFNFPSYPSFNAILARSSIPFYGGAGIYPYF